MAMDGMALVTPATLSPASVQQDAPAEGDSGAFREVLGAVADNVGRANSPTRQPRSLGQDNKGAPTAGQPLDAAPVSPAAAPLTALGLAAELATNGIMAAGTPDGGVAGADTAAQDQSQDKLAPMAALVPGLVSAASQAMAVAQAVANATPAAKAAPDQTAAGLEDLAGATDPASGETNGSPAATDPMALPVLIAALVPSPSQPNVVPQPGSDQAKAAGAAIAAGEATKSTDGLAALLDTAAERKAIGSGIGSPSAHGAVHAGKAAALRGMLHEGRFAGDRAETPAAVLDAASKPVAGVEALHMSSFAELAAKAVEHAEQREKGFADLAPQHGAHAQAGGADAGLLPTVPGDGSAAAPGSASSDLAAPRVNTAAPVRQVAQVAVTIAAQGKDEGTLSVALDPEELGRVEISIERQGTTAQVRVLAERPETLTMLQRDQRELDRLLGQAGIGEEGRTLSFGLSADSDGGRASDGRSRQNNGGGGSPAIRLVMPEHTAETRSVLGLIDIAI